MDGVRVKQVRVSVESLIMLIDLNILIVAIVLWHRRVDEASDCEELLLPQF